MKRLTTGDVMQRLGIRSRETLRLRVKSGNFPQPVKDEGSNLNFFIESEIDAYISQQAEARDQMLEAA